MDTIQFHTVKSWLLAVTRNHCIDLRRKKRELNFSELSNDDGENPVSKIPAANESDPEQHLDRAEEHKRIIGAITRLPEKIRTTIILRYIQELTYDVIAKSLGCPLNSVKVYLHRGRKMLAQILEEPMQD